MKRGLFEVKSHHEVKSGDYLIHIDIAGNAQRTTYKLVGAVDATEAMRILAEHITFYLVHHFSGQVDLRVVQYDSPIRQRLVKTVKIS